MVEFENLKAPIILSNDKIGTRQGIIHLADQGYKKIAHLRGLPSSSLANARNDAYIETLNELKLESHKDWILTCNHFSIPEGEKLTQKLMNLNNPPDAIFCINDIVAIGVLKTLKKLNMKVPEDIGVLGFSNSDLSQVSHPTLSSIHQPGVSIGKKSIRLVLSHINDQKDISNKYLKVKTKLIIRESTLRKNRSIYNYKIM
jgi:LacI family transcriptional regulator